MSRRISLMAVALPAAAIVAGCTLQRSAPGTAGALASSAMADDHMAHMNAADLSMPAMRSTGA